METWGWTLLIPALAGISAWFMCFVQNKFNVLQAEQGAQLFLLNIWINPKDYIDYEALEKSKAELKEARQYLAAGKKESRRERGL